MSECVRGSLFISLSHLPVMEIDLLGTFNLSRACFEALKETRGSILNISATLHYTATPWQTHASAAKVSLLMTTCLLSLIHYTGGCG